MTGLGGSGAGDTGDDFVAGGASVPSAAAAAGGSEGTVARGDVAHAARSGAVQVLTIIAQAMLTVTHVLLARLFGRAVFGGYQATLAILEMVTRGGTGGADKGVLRYVAGYRARGETQLVQSALGTGLRLCLAIAGTAAAILIVVATPLARLTHQPTIATALRVMAPAALFTGAMWVLVQASLAVKVTRANLVVRGLGEPLFLMIAGLLAAVAGRSLEYLAVAHVIAAAATFVLAVIVVGRLFGAGELRRALAAPRLRGFARFSLPLGAADLMNAILQRADVVLLTIFVGTSAAGVYAAAEFITRVVANIRYAFDSVAAAVFSEALHLGQRERLRDNLVLMTRWVATVAAPIAATVIILRRDVLHLYGPSFEDGAGALCVLAVGHLLNATLGLTGWILVGNGRSRLILMNNVIGAVVNVITGLALIPRFGLIGTAIAALGSVILLQLAAIIEVRLVSGVHPFHPTLVKPFIAGGVMFAVEHVVNTLVAPPALRIVAVVIAGLVVYGGGLALLGLQPEDRRLVASAWARVRGVVRPERGR